MTTHVTTGADLLETIVAATRRIVEVREGRESVDALLKRAMEHRARPGAFRAALARPHDINVIAECKRRSPSRGVLRDQYDATAIASSYADAGAAAISVLTEPTFFDGSLEHLAAVRQKVTTPLLRKDFVVSEYQLLAARANGERNPICRIFADCCDASATGSDMTTTPSATSNSRREVIRSPCARAEVFVRESRHRALSRQLNRRQAIAHQGKRKFMRTL